MLDFWYQQSFASVLPLLDNIIRRRRVPFAVIAPSSSPSSPITHVTTHHVHPAVRVSHRRRLITGKIRDGRAKGRVVTTGAVRVKIERVQYYCTRQNGFCHRVLIVVRASLDTG